MRKPVPVSGSGSAPRPAWAHKPAWASEPVLRGDLPVRLAPVWALGSARKRVWEWALAVRPLSVVGSDLDSAAGWGVRPGLASAAGSAALVSLVWAVDL
ncbi:hypothetical protein DSM43519_00699 [Mycobacterium marinum]|nr:hypothetical protein DSM43519_00699 [Mycobacterium marinum]